MVFIGKQGSVLAKIGYFVSLFWFCVDKIDLKGIDFVNLISYKSELNLKLFSVRLFWLDWEVGIKVTYIFIKRKVSWTKNLGEKYLYNYNLESKLHS